MQVRRQTLLDSSVLYQVGCLSCGVFKDNAQRLSDSLCQMAGEQLAEARQEKCHPRTARGVTLRRATWPYARHLGRR